MNIPRILLTLLLALGCAPAGASERSAGALDASERSAGALDAVGPEGEALGPCPLEHTDVRTEISGFVARVTVTQTFRNPYPDPIEAIYTFPLSERGAIDAMWIRTGEREIRGEIKRREEARQIYENAKAAGQLAALLDQERPNIFTQAIANLMPGAEVQVEIRYVESLAYEDGGFEWSFPMVVGPRFVPGAAVGRSGSGRLSDTNRVSDASRITPPVAPEGTRAGHDISVFVEIDAGVEIERIDSRLHEIAVKRPDSTRAVVELAQHSEIPNRDFVLRYDVAGDAIKSGVLTHRDGGDGYATFILIPPKRVTPQTAAPKELVFVIDRSGSQSGLPLLKAKETMEWTLEHLNPNDTFQIVSFSNTTEQLFARPQLATPDAVRKARAYVRALEANGGTMMAEAIQEVCRHPAEGNRLRIVTFMTDGYVGNDFEVIDMVKRLRGRSRWFPFGTGNSTNRFLLDQMAWHGGGEVEYVLLSEDGERIAKKFYDRIASPVLTDVQLEFRGLDVVDVVPYELSDLWAQKPLIIHARYGHAGRGEVVLRGFQEGRAVREALTVELPERDASNPGIASMWARARVDELMARDLAGLQSGSYPEALEAEIVDVALAHRILTQFTSFVAVEDKVINENGTSRTVTVPVELPHGVDRQGTLGKEGRWDAAQTATPGRMNRGLGSLASNAPRMARKVAPSSLQSMHRELAYDALSEEDSPEPAKLDATLLAKLGPNLRALVEGRMPQAPYMYRPDGMLAVRVELDKSTAKVIEAVKRIGLRINVTTDNALVGTLALSDLESLLELEFVTNVELR